ncbi:unnamed protein product [Arabis nemorensis]|uniref:Uncharacterized protein n=1 Tax=Arabis nemorensis TaxID=586526 RepID=A0A565BDL8_9BRAS|nr:unnamed protein product [Arabis nemorensis]
MPIGSAQPCSPLGIDRLVASGPVPVSHILNLLLLCSLRRRGITTLSTPSPMSSSPDPPSKQSPPTGSDELLFAEHSDSSGTGNQILQPPPSTPMAPPEFPPPEPTLLRPSSAEIADGSFLPSLPWYEIFLVIRRPIRSLWPFSLTKALSIPSKPILWYAFVVGVFTSRNTANGSLRMSRRLLQVFHKIPKSIGDVPRWPPSVDQKVDLELLVRFQNLLNDQLEMFRDGRPSARAFGKAPKPIEGGSLCFIDSIFCAKLSS